MPAKTHRTPENEAPAAAPIAYCTILATNYLPKALALSESLREHENAELHILLIDAETPADLPDVPGVRLLSTDFLGLGLEEIHRLAMSYDLVEYATSVKPVFLARLLETHLRAAYIDPDMYLVSRIPELVEDLDTSDGGLLLTPHFLRPPGADAFTSEGHMLYAGVFNLGFVAVDRRAAVFLDWWWARLREECLFDVLGGLFVDQKWVDLGAVYFAGRAWQHPGYNVSVVNLTERPVGEREGLMTVGHEGMPLRIFHFHGFDANAPGELSTRFNDSTAGIRGEGSALDRLCHEYADRVLVWQAKLGAAPAYRYAKDSSGAVLGRQVRRAYRVQSLQEGTAMPSAFTTADAAAYKAWRRGVLPNISRAVAGDAVKAARATAPEAAAKFKQKFPGVVRLTSRTVVDKSGLWG